MHGVRFWRCFVSLTPSIPFAPKVSDGLGAEGRVVAEGRLECSGDYVVEEEEEEEDDDDDESRPAGVYRRLIFLKNEGVVQTEVTAAGLGDTPLHGCCKEDRLYGNSKSSSVRLVLHLYLSTPARLTRRVALTLTFWRNVRP